MTQLNHVTRTKTHYYHIDPIDPADAGGWRRAMFDCQNIATHRIRSHLRDGMNSGLSTQRLCETHTCQMKDVMDGKEG